MTRSITPSSLKSPDAMASGRGCSPEKRRFKVWLCSGCCNERERGPGTAFWANAVPAKERNSAITAWVDRERRIKCGVHILGLQIPVSLDCAGEGNLAWQVAN